MDWIWDDEEFDWELLAMREYTLFLFPEGQEPVVMHAKVPSWLQRELYKRNSLAWAGVLQFTDAHLRHAVKARTTE